MYSVPFYGESSFLMYRKDLFEQAGITLSPTADLAGGRRRGRQARQARHGRYLPARQAGMG